MSGPNSSGELVQVDVNHDLESLDPDVATALTGLSYISGAILSAGRDELLGNYWGVGGLTEAISEAMRDSDTADQLQKLHPDLDQLFEPTQEALNSDSFLFFVRQLGALDTECSLSEVESEVNKFRLSIVGFD